jgi:hypothetical protein
MEGQSTPPHADESGRAWQLLLSASSMFASTAVSISSLEIRVCRLDGRDVARITAYLFHAAAR